jgi:hypothetical protein
MSLRSNTLAVAGLALAFALAGLSAGVAQTRAQPQSPARTPVLRDPAILQQSVQDDEDDTTQSTSPTISRQTYDRLRQAIAEERRQAASQRPRPRQYEVECHRVTEVMFDPWELRVMCDRDDEYGQHHYILWLNLYGIPDQDTPDEAERRWIAERLLDAIQVSRSDPSAALVLRISALDLNERSSVRDLTGFRLRYSD